MQAILKHELYLLLINDNVSQIFNSRKHVHLGAFSFKRYGGVRHSHGIVGFFVVVPLYKSFVFLFLFSFG